MVGVMAALATSGGVAAPGVRDAVKFTGHPCSLMAAMLLKQRPSLMRTVYKLTVGSLTEPAFHSIFIFTEKT